MVNYKDAGVNIDAGNASVDLIKPHVTKTFNANVLTGLGTFGSLFSIDFLKSYEHPVMVQSVDGVGTKTKVAVMAGKFENLGYDLFSAATNDIVVMGAKPLTFLNYVAHDKLVPSVMASLVKGMSDACLECGVALVGGETAEMPGVYQPDEIDMVGIITGVVEKSKIIDGNRVKSGFKLFGVNSSGLHTNGFSFARKIFFDIGKYNINHKFEELAGNLDDVLLAPHINYTSFVQDMLKANVDIAGIAHITGGGIVENIIRAVPKGLGIKVNTKSWPVPPLFKLMQEIGKVETFEMHRAFNMGIGMVFIAPEAEGEKIASFAKNYKLACFEVGQVVNSLGDERVVLS